MKSLLVTGGAGFIGSNFVRYVIAHTDYTVINLDALTYAGNLENLADLENESRHTFIRGDICNRSLVSEVMEKYNIDTMINFAAESHVDRSIEMPGIFLETNVQGTQALLDAALHAWRSDTKDKYCREYREGVRFLQVSTDEVYGTLSPTDPPFCEINPLMPNSPYSASKASADLFVRVYHETYGLPINITRCSNNYGPYQFPEKLVPLMIGNALGNKRLPVYGDGMQVRDWLYVEDHCSGILSVLERGTAGEIYNIGGNNEKANKEIVSRILSVLGKPESLIDHVKDRPGHDRRYAIDNAKITSMLGWEPIYTFDSGMDRTIAWYLEHPQWVESVASGAYLDYCKRMYAYA